jgi:hypothetical protein
VCARSRLNLAAITCTGRSELSNHLRHRLPVQIATTVMSTREHCNERRGPFVSFIPQAARRLARAPQGAEHVFATHLSQIHERNGADALRVQQARRAEAGSRTDCRRHLGSDGGAEVRNADADPAGDAKGGDDHAYRREERGLLRDLDDAVRTADPAVWAARNDRLGIRRRDVGEQTGPARAPRAVAHDRSEVEPAGPREVD